MKLTPIEELAKQSLAKVDIDYPYFKSPPVFRYVFSESQLEAFRQAIISDFVSTLVPVAWNARRKDWPVGEMKPFCINPSWAEISIPLYALPDWITK